VGPIPGTALLQSPWSELDPERCDNERALVAGRSEADPLAREAEKKKGKLRAEDKKEEAIGARIEQVRKDKATAMKKVVKDERRCQGVIVQVVLHRLVRVVTEEGELTESFSHLPVLSAVSGISFDLCQGTEKIRVEVGNDMRKWNVQPLSSSSAASRLKCAERPRANIMRQDSGKGAPCIAVGKLDTPSATELGDVREMSQSQDGLAWFETLSDSLSDERGRPAEAVLRAEPDMAEAVPNPGVPYQADGTYPASKLARLEPGAKALSPQCLVHHTAQEYYLRPNELVSVVGVLVRDKGGLKLLPGNQGHIASHPGIAPACAETSVGPLPELEVQGLEMPPRIESQPFHLAEKARKLRAPRKSAAGAR